MAAVVSIYDDDDDDDDGYSYDNNDESSTFCDATITSTNVS